MDRDRSFYDILIVFNFAVCVGLIIGLVAISSQINSLEKYVKEIKLNVVIKPEEKVEINEKTEVSLSIKQVPEIKVETNPKPKGNMPSYCYPEKYTIIKGNNGKYYMKLPGGIITGESFETEQEAKNAVLEWAKNSYENWQNYGGY